MNGLETWAMVNGCNAIFGNRGKSTENLPVEKKYLEKISLIEKVATFVKEFFSKNGRTWSEINKIDFKINERTFSKISKDELQELIENAAFKKISPGGQKSLNTLLLEQRFNATWSKITNSKDELDHELINRATLDELKEFAKNPKFEKLSHRDKKIITNRIDSVKRFSLLRPNSDTQDFLIKEGTMPRRPRKKSESPFQVDDKYFIRKKEIATTETKRWHLDFLAFLAKNPDRQETHLLGLSEDDRKDYANEIFTHAAAPLTPHSTVDFYINIDDLLSFQERGCEVSTGEYQFDLDLDRLDKFIDGKKLEGENAKEILRKLLQDIFPEVTPALFDRTLNIFSQTIPNIFIIAMQPLVDPYILKNSENLSISLIKEKKTVEVKSCHPIVDTFHSSGIPQGIGQFDVVISIPLDPNKVAHFKIMRS